MRYIKRSSSASVNTTADRRAINPTSSSVVLGRNQDTVSGVSLIFADCSTLSCNSMFLRLCLFDYLMCLFNHKMSKKAIPFYVNIHKYFARTALLVV